jgi:hypothetical protein
MYGDGKLKAGLVGKERASNTGPHRLKGHVRNMLKKRSEYKSGQTFRLLNAGTFGLALETLDNLRLAASEDLDSNCWGGGGAISREGRQALFCGGGVDGMWNGTTVGSLYTASRVQYSIDLIEMRLR